MVGWCAVPAHRLPLTAQRFRSDFRLTRAVVHSRAGPFGRIHTGGLVAVLDGCVDLHVGIVGDERRILRLPGGDRRVGRRASELTGLTVPAILVAPGERQDRQAYCYW